jgi:hypothetical protein
LGFPGDDRSDPVPSNNPDPQRPETPVVEPVSGFLQALHPFQLIGNQIIKMYAGFFNYSWINSHL